MRSCRSSARPAAVEPPGRRSRAPSSISSSPVSPRRSPAASAPIEVSIGNLISGGDNGSSDVLTTIVSARPDLLRLRHERERTTSPISAPRPKGACRRRATVTCRPCPAQPTRRTGRTKGTLNFVDNQVDRSAARSAPGRDFPIPIIFITPGSSAASASRAPTRIRAILIPDAAIVTDQSRKSRDDGGRRTATVVPKVIRPGPSHGGLRIVRSGLVGRRHDHHQRADARPARRQGDARAGHDRRSTNRAS